MRKILLDTIRICKNRNVLKEYLENKEQEIIDIMMTLFDDEQILKAYAKDIDDNATHREARKTAEKLIRRGKMSLDEIADCIPALTFDELKKLETEVMQMV